MAPLQRQTFDAFGRNVGGYAMFVCLADKDWANDPWHLAHEFDGPVGDECYPLPAPCPPEGAGIPQPVARIQEGSFGWRGGEGSQTNLAAQDMPGSPSACPNQGPAGLKYSAYQRPSTGLVYMQARYYEPETGRFTEADAMRYGTESVLSGQDNRWIYCAGDPVNRTDPSGAMLVESLIAFGLGYIIGMVAAFCGYQWNLGLSDAKKVLAWLAGMASGVCAATLPDYMVNLRTTLTTIGVLLGAGLMEIWKFGFLAIMPAIGVLAGSFALGFMLGQWMMTDAEYSREKERQEPSRAWQQRGSVVALDLRGSCGSSASGALQLGRATRAEVAYSVLARVCAES